jgi:DNA repair protein RadC
MPGKERPYQYAFDFGQKPLGESGFIYEHGQRFVRTLQEEVIVRGPVEVARHLMTRVFHPFEAFEQEELWSLLLNNKHRITHEVMIYRGTINTMPIRQAEIFKPAIRFNAAAFILAHNHPSNDPSPSQQDGQMTAEVRDMGQRLDVPLLDHLVIGKDRWVSLKQHGLGFDG